MKENTNIFERISQLVELKGIKGVPELAMLLGYDNPEKLYRLKRKPDAKPSFEMVEDFSNKFEDLNIRWFITGLGEPLQEKLLSYTVTPAATDTFNEPMPQYPSRTPIAISGVPGVNNAPPTAPPTAEYGVNAVYLTPKIITVDTKERDNIIYVPVRAAAGYLNGYGDPTFMETLPSFTLPGLNDRTYRAFEVSGDSMFPTLENKEMIIGQWVEKLDYIREDRVHILVTKNDGIIVKRLLNRVEKYGYVIAKSDAVNDRNLYPNIEVPPEDILEIWYAVWHGGFNFKAPGDLWKRQNNLEAELTDVLRRLKQAGL